eukprot:104362-Pelagomonas_calceolata.AAC.9
MTSQMLKRTQDLMRSRLAHPGSHGRRKRKNGSISSSGRREWGAASGFQGLLTCNTLNRACKALLTNKCHQTLNSQFKCPIITAAGAAEELEVESSTISKL